MRKVVVNSTPLISLYKINKLNLLKEIYGSIYVPYGVYEELSIKDKYNFLNELDFINLDTMIPSSRYLFCYILTFINS